MFRLNYESTLVKNEIAQVLFENHLFKIEIVGHTDRASREI